MINKKYLIIIVIAVLLIVVLLVVKNNRKSQSQNSNDEIPEPTSYTESALEAKKQEAEIHNEIKAAIDEVEKDYQVAHSNYAGYKRSDFYNAQRLNENMSNGEIEFVESSTFRIVSSYCHMKKKIQNSV